MDEPVELGPFAIRERIAEGGMGAVYRAEHRSTGVPVAVKVIGRATDPREIRRFRREVRAHAGLTHPGIVHLFEFGTIDARAAEASGGELRRGSPYVAMELADGRTVRDAMPLTSWNETRTILVQVLDALAYSHARNIIHRDLKPANLLRFEAPESADADWRIKVADFGIAHALGREMDAETRDLEQAPGTPHYMPPEQIHGAWREYGPWTDLYALGCITWHLVCGRPPFRGDHPIEIAVKHDTEGRPPLEPQFPVPDRLEHWIHRCMAVDPHRRFRRAADAHWALPRDSGTDEQGRAVRDDAPERETRPEGAPSDATTRPVVTNTLPPETNLDPARADTLESPPVDEPPDDETPAAELDALEAHPPVPNEWRPEAAPPLAAPLVDAGLGLFELREPPFVDRENECGAIWRALLRSLENSTVESVFITGAPGTGKSRLAEWMSVRAHEVGAASVVRAVHTPEGGPSQGVRGALERELRTVRMPRDRVFDHLVDRLPPLERDEPEIREWDARALTEYLRPTGRRQEVDGPAYRFESARQKRALVVRILLRFARRRPVVLWLDDLQWGAEALGLVEHLHAMDEQSPSVLILATIRSDVVSERPRLSERLEELTAADRAQNLPLDPLSRADQRRLLQGMLPLEDELTERVVARTEGHPLFAMQLLEHWVESGALHSGPEGFAVPGDHEVELPDDIHTLWMDRLDRLVEHGPAAGRGAALAALELAATLGREVDRREWRTALDRAGLDPPSGLVGRLAEHGLGETTPAGWSFAHGLLVDSLEQRADEEGRLRDHHRACAEALEELAGPAEIARRERIAEHWTRAGEAGRALEPLRRAIVMAGKRSRESDRRRLLERRSELLDRLDVPATDSRRLANEIERARIWGDRGETDRARELLEEVWERIDADAPTLRARCGGLLARFERHAGRLDRAEEWARDALEAAERADDPTLRDRCHRRLARIYISRGDVDRADRHADRALELADEADNPYGRIVAMMILAHVREARGESYGGIFEEVRREAAENGYVLHEVQALNGLAERARYEGRLDDARDYYNEHLDRLRRELDRPVVECIGELNLAQNELRAGRFDEAIELVRSAEARLESIGALESRRATIHLIRLVHAAGTEQRMQFDELWTRVETGWPEAWRSMKDHAWLLDLAGDYTRDAGWSTRARAAWELASERNRELGDEQNARRVERKARESR